jgi:NTP pyrophosphatase (non-canonical NTP hydrolase)
LNIIELLNDSHKTARDHGWWDKGLAGPDGIVRPVTFPTCIAATPDERMGISIEMIASKFMLAVSELSEALEELREGKSPTEVYWKKGSDEQHFPHGPEAAGTSVEKLIADGYKPEGVPIELADVFIRLADLCQLLEIDLPEALATKADFNRTRTYRHGNKAL